MDYRTLQSPHDFEQVVELEIAVWQLEPLDAVPKDIMRAIALHGGSVIGAYDADRLAGMALAFPARHGKRWILWSHMAAVHPDYQGHGIGVGIKQAQRTWALANGYDEIRWTFDPLQRGNANFNLHRLGATASVYHVNHYGLMRDAINRDLPSDRVEASWKLNSRRVKTLAEGRTVRGAVDLTDRCFVLRAEADGAPRIERIPTETAQIFIEIPVDRKTLDAEALIKWRLALREALQNAFTVGYSAVDFIETEGRACYVLEAPTAWYLYVLECADGSLYTGISPDVQQRLKLHQTGRGAQYTRTRRPVALRGVWRFPDQSGALKAEASFKTLSRPTKLRYLSQRAAYEDGPWIDTP